MSSGIFWWIRQVVLVLLCCFFLLFGINLLVSAYSFNDPFRFIMTFFSSNLIILISATLLIGFICRIIKLHKSK
ncbi:MAG TPA: hypothetical protein ENN86_04860 [Desulfobacteraceae bacterium]|nr:hypothetical protein [Desulfobacteraceae bacterium]